MEERETEREGEKGIETKIQKRYGSVGWQVLEDREIERGEKEIETLKETQERWQGRLASIGREREAAREGETEVDTKIQKRYGSVRWSVLEERNRERRRKGDKNRESYKREMAV